MIHSPPVTLQLMFIVFAALRHQPAAQHCSQAHSRDVTFTVPHPAGRLQYSLLGLLHGHKTQHHTEINLDTSLPLSKPERSVVLCPPDLLCVFLTHVTVQSCVTR